ncbi:MAG: glycosyltransferase family 4 protein [Stellaceae bacterium]
MKLLALVGDAFGGSGGIARYNRDLMTALTNSGAAIILLPREGRAERGTLPPGIDQRAPRGPASLTAAALVTAWRDGPFDAVFCGHVNLAPAAAIAAALLRVPLWLQLHGIEAWKPLSPAQHWAVERAALVTAVSRHTRHCFLGLSRVEPWRTRVLPNTVDDRFAPGPKPEFLLKRHGLHGKTVLLTVGRLSAAEHGKGHDRVIAALPALAASQPDIAYLIVGEGDDRPRLLELARATGVADRVLFTGAVSDTELPDYYRAADVFVMPSVQEGFGIVLLEAAASGLPVVAGNIDGSPDALADGALGWLVDPHAPSELVRAIGQAIGAASPQGASVARYGLTNFTRQATELARELVSSARPPLPTTRPAGAG